MSVGLALKMMGGHAGRASLLMVWQRLGVGAGGHSTGSDYRQQARSGCVTGKKSGVMQGENLKSVESVAMIIAYRYEFFCSRHFVVTDISQ